MQRLLSPYLVPLIGIGLHSFVDGVVYSVTFHVNLFTGGLTALGMVGHEFPEGIMTYLLLVRAGQTPSRASMLAWSAAAITTPLGTLLSCPLVDKINPPTLGVLLALSAGALLYVGATHLLPQAEHERRRFSVLALAAGVGVAVLVVFAEGRCSPLPLHGALIGSLGTWLGDPEVFGRDCRQLERILSCSRPDSA